MSDETAAPAPASRTGLAGLLGGTVGASLWVVVVLALLAASVVLGLRVRSASQDEALRRDALQAARQEALNLTSVDGTDLDQDLQRVLEGATGDFRTQFSQQATQLKSVLTTNQVRAQGQVLDAGLVRVDDTSATALVSIDSVVRNKAIPKGQTRTYRMQLDLERTGSRWLTSSLQFVS